MNSNVEIARNGNTLRRSSRPMHSLLGEETETQRGAFLPAQVVSITIAPLEESLFFKRSLKCTLLISNIASPDIRQGDC